jgi:hypothetical protein
MRKYSIEAMREELSRVQNKDGSLTGLVISGIGAAYQNTFLKEK